MKTFLVLAVYCTAVFAAPPNIRLTPGSFWDFHSSVLDEFETNLRRMREEFDQLEKSLESGFKFGNTDETGIQILQNGTSIFNLDPSKVKNESFSDTKIVDDKIVHTEEKVIANGNSVVHFKKVEITPKGVSVTSTDDKPRKTFKTPASSPTPESSSPGFSRNDLNSESVDTDEKATRQKDVEEIESVQPIELRVPLSATKPKFDIPDEIAENNLSESSSNVNPSSFVNLGGDTKVNDILSENIASGALIQPEPEAEIIEINTNNINRPNYNVSKNNPINNDNQYYYYGYAV